MEVRSLNTSVFHCEARLSVESNDTAPQTEGIRMSLDSSLPNLLAFCRTVECESFTLAAKSLRVTPAAVSRAVARLEHALGATLFRRTTRELRATAKGRAYYEKCVVALRLLADGERELAEQDDSAVVRGLVRLSVPTTFGPHYLLPRMAGFRVQYPAIELEIQVSNQNIDFVREGFDLAVRMGTVADSGVVARKLGSFAVGVFASPKYLARCGIPKSVAALGKHECIAFAMPRTGRILPWIFSNPPAEFLPPSNIRVVEDPSGAIALCRAGEGLFQTYPFMVESELQRGELVEVLASHAGCTRRFSLLYPKDATRSKAVKAVTDFILARARSAKP
jgi:DNA-binding transcriptional LysR family regulator